MKKIALLSLALIICLSIVGCGNNGAQDDNPSDVGSSQQEMSSSVESAGEEGLVDSSTPKESTDEKNPLKKMFLEIAEKLLETEPFTRDDFEDLPTDTDFFVPLTDDYSLELMVYAPSNEMAKEGEDHIEVTLCSYDENGEIVQVVVRTAYLHNEHAQTVKARTEEMYEGETDKITLFEDDKIVFADDTTSYHKLLYGTGQVYENKLKQVRQLLSSASVPQEDGTFIFNEQLLTEEGKEEHSIQNGKYIWFSVIDDEAISEGVDALMKSMGMGG